MILATLALAATLQAAPLDRAIESAMRDTGTKTVGVAVIQDDRVVYLRTFGTSADAPFYIASSTKSFTALAARLLAEEKKLSLDAPLTAVMPDLKLTPPLDASRVTLRDLLALRAGFRASSVSFRTAYTGEWDDAKLLDLFAKYSSVAPRGYRYDNTGFVLAGAAIERAAGEEWQSVLAKRIFQPLGMQTATTRACSGKSDRTMHAAGGICASVSDLARWVRVQMNDGTLDGKRVFPRRVMTEVHAPQTNLEQQYGRIQRYAYALGWFHGDYEGDLLMHHFGSIAFARAHISWMPERNLGVVVVQDDVRNLADPIALLAYDTLLGKADARAKFDADVRALVEREAKNARDLAVAEQKLIAEAPQSEEWPLAALVGTYRNDEMGTIVVREENGQLVAVYGDLRSSLTRGRGALFIVHWDGPEALTFGRNSLTWHDRPYLRDGGQPR